MSGFNNTGVPYYANRKFPAIRPRAIPEPSETYREGKARQMQARTYVRDFIRDNWRTGDRFFFTTESRDCYSRYGIKQEKSAHAGQSGTFIEKRLIGNCWFVIVEWDDENYKPIGLANRVGMFDFYHYAFKDM